MKNIVKFRHEEHEGFLSVVDKDGVFYSLVEKNTPKVESAKETHKLLISYELKNPKFIEATVDIIEDFLFTKEIYEQLEKDKNLYFKELNDQLCVLKIEKNKEI